MGEIVKIEDVKKAIVPLKGVDVIPDSLIAHLYRVQTKKVNQAAGWDGLKDFVHNN